MAEDNLQDWINCKFSRSPMRTQEVQTSTRERMWGSPQLIRPRPTLPAQFFPDPQIPAAYTGPEFYYGIAVPDGSLVRAVTKLGNVDPIAPLHDILRAVGGKNEDGQALVALDRPARPAVAWCEPENIILKYYSNYDKHTFDTDALIEAGALEKVDKVFEWVKDLMDDDSLEIGWYISYAWWVEDDGEAGRSTEESEGADADADA